MGSRRRALIVVPVLVLSALGIIVLARGDKDDRRRPPPGPTTVPVPVTEGNPKKIDLAPPPVRVSEAPPRATEAPRPATEPGPGPATEPGPGPATESGRLRGVRGRVVDAVGGEPIAGALVTWGEPPPAVAEQLLSSPALLNADRGGAVTDAEGRFDLGRLDDGPPRAALFATATGWASASAVVGLKEEVVLRLGKAGGLEVHFLGAPSKEAGVLAEGPDGARRQASRGDWPKRVEVPAGRWRVHLDGAEPGTAHVEAGKTAVVELTAPSAVHVAGTVTGAAEGSQLVLVRTGDLDSTAPVVAAGDHPLLVAAGGRFQGDLPPGVYAARVVDASERVVRAPVRVAPPGPVELALALDPAQPVEVALKGLPPDATLPDGLGLVGTEGDPPELLALDRVQGERRYAGSAPVGRWSVFLDSRYLADIDLPASGPVTLAAVPFVVTIRWRLPDGLRPGETLRGTVAAIPAAFAARPIGQRFREQAAADFEASKTGAPTPLELLAPGRYVLAGETDLGPFQVEVDLPGATTIEVPLAEGK